MSDFLPKTAVITGGASGIGFALAKRLAKQSPTHTYISFPGVMVTLKIHEVACDG